MLTDNWNDWFQYRTQYYLLYRDSNSVVHEIGHVKIGEFDMAENQDRPNIPDSFETLGSQFFSLGQDDAYYQHLTALSGDFRDDVLRALRDMALDQDLFDRAQNEDVTGVSLLRSVSPATVTGQFRRLARGAARLSGYEFSYFPPYVHTEGRQPARFSFTVEPDSEPPSNIHVLIGRNGVGKTYVLNAMAHALMNHGASEDNEHGQFVADVLTDQGSLFAGLVSVSFSAFDPFEPPRRRWRDNRAKEMGYTYVGLKWHEAERTAQSESVRPPGLKGHHQLAQEFAESVDICAQGGRLARWRRALETLEADPIFAEAEVSDLGASDVSSEDRKAASAELFHRLSTGHKIVLLMMTRLVESVEERTLVLIDEPESHLHPPLLSAFIRALADLMTDRNGVAIVATHSPVVLQEVPRRCASRMHRSGRDLVVDRPEVETFGENVGVLTREIFGLEVTRSGFHRLLAEAVEESPNVEDIIERFGAQLGGEAKAIVRFLVASRGQGTRL